MLKTVVVMSCYNEEQTIGIVDTLAAHERQRNEIDLLGSGK